MKTWEEYQPVVRQTWFPHNLLAVQEAKLLPGGGGARL